MPSGIWEGDYMREKCNTCTEPTRRVIGFWDGCDKFTGEPTHGQIYECNSTTCELKQEIDKAAAKSQAEIQIIQQKHLARGIDMQTIDSARINREITMRNLSNAVGISPSLYCDYRACRKEIPQETYQKIVEFLGTRHIPDDFLVKNCRTGQELTGDKRQQAWDVFSGTIDTFLENDDGEDDGEWQA